MASKILIKRSTTAGEIPTTADLDTGELALNTADRRIFTNNSGTIVELGTTPTALDITGNVDVGGTFDVVGQVTVDDLTATGDVNLTGATTTVATPTADSHAATKLYVDTEVNAILDGAPAALNTLNEIAAAINDDANLYTTLTDSIATKLPLAGGTMTGDIVLGANKITTTADPSADDDLARKGYVDTILGSATAAATSATNAASSASSAATSASNAATSASDANAYSDLADGFATAAGNSATAASNSATSASNSATTATTKATEAATSATNAANAYDNFDDRYLGAKASDPTTDNDGDALITGAMYFDSTNNVMKVYNGTEWANASSSIEGIKSDFQYTATASQTVFSGNDDDSNELVIDKAGLVNVYLNGVRLSTDDYTVSAAGNSVTLGSGAAVNDIVEIEVFGNFAGQSGADVAITGGSITGLSTLTSDSLTVDTNTLHVDATNNRVGIGTTSPAFALDVDGVSNQFAANFTGTTAGYIRVTNDTGYADLGSTGHNMLLRTNGVERARIDSSGNLLVGTTSQYGTQKLSVNGGIAIDGRNASNPGLCEKGDTDTGIYWPAANALSVTTGGTERMRIDSSGNLLVGTTESNPTSPSVNVAGQAFSTTGGVRSTVDANPAATFNRKTSDGPIALFRKDGTTVGSIGADGGDLFIGTGDTGIRFSDSANAIVGQNPSTVANSYDFVDLGTSGIRFKDLFLSGGVYLGGTGSANHLDDYEEGTWTPSSPHVTLTVTAGKNYYVKIGKLVYVQFDVTFPSSTSGTHTLITTPFQIQEYASGSVGWSQSSEVIQVHGGSVGIYLMQGQGTSNAHLSYGEAAGKRYIGSLTYYTTA